MNVSNKKEPIILFLGDLFFFYLALWVTLFLRYAEIPNGDLLINHLIPFSYIFFIWVFLFFLAGLYEKHTLALKVKLPNRILNAVIVNSLVAVIFFYLIPVFGIAPKTNLFIYLIISFSFIVFWRRFCVKLFSFKKKENAILIGTGSELRELKEEINNNNRYRLKFISSIDINDIEQIDFKREVIDKVYAENVSSIVMDLKNEKIETVLPHLYNLIFSNVKFVDFYKVYEEIFDRVPLSLVGCNWFLENISFSSLIAYDFLKRAMDITISLVLGVVSLIVYPFVALAIKLEDGGPVFVVQDRIGRGNKLVKLCKFRSMTRNDSGEWLEKNKGNKVTRVGFFIRKTRIDELPQLWNVLMGDLSLIGPRPDIIDLGRKLAKEIPYYTVRNLITPGLSGWAQIKQDFPPQSVEETKLRLSYDFYYIKNRSLMLDIKIALKTVKTLLSRQGM